MHMAGQCAGAGKENRRQVLLTQQVTERGIRLPPRLAARTVAAGCK